MTTEIIYTKSRVRSEFQYMRTLMRIADDMMRKGITDFSQEGEAYQLALELGACAATFEAYVTERMFAEEN